MSGTQRIFKLHKFSTCVKPCGMRARHGECRSKYEDRFRDGRVYVYLCVCPCHLIERSPEELREILTYLLFELEEYQQEQVQAQLDHLGVQRERGRTCQVCGQYYEWIGTSTGYKCGCGSSGAGAFGLPGGPNRGMGELG